ncbi:MAG: RecX family transcriptional regulator [Prevotellaceae bacterium]|jgi:regulatory protein|nr:RecX family transcriptional regulator [Prevotellaceae bacterium]
MSAKREVSFDDVLRSMQQLCSSREICISEAAAKMKKRNVADADAEKITAMLLQSGYIDEERYAKAFVNDKFAFDKWGAHKIRRALAVKGISETHIDKAIAEDENLAENSDAAVYRLLVKKAELIHLYKNSNADGIYAKLVRFGLSRGFDCDTVAKHASAIVAKRKNETE